MGRVRLPGGTVVEVDELERLAAERRARDKLARGRQFDRAEVLKKLERRLGPRLPRLTVAELAEEQVELDEEVEEEVPKVLERRSYKQRVAKKISEQEARRQRLAYWEEIQEEQGKEPLVLEVVDLEEQVVELKRRVEEVSEFRDSEGQMADEAVTGRDEIIELLKLRHERERESANLDERAQLIDARLTEQRTTSDALRKADRKSGDEALRGRDKRIEELTEELNRQGAAVSTALGLLNREFMRPNISNADDTVLRQLYTLLDESDSTPAQSVLISAVMDDVSETVTGARKELDTVLSSRELRQELDLDVLDMLEKVTELLRGLRERTIKAWHGSGRFLDPRQVS